MAKSNVLNLFGHVGDFDMAFKTNEHKKQGLMKDYNLADEVITAIAEKGTILIDGLASDLEDKAVANGQNCLKFRADFAGLTEWLFTDLKLILYVGERKKMATLSDEGRYLYENNLTVRGYIEREDKKRADEEATVTQNLINARRQGVFLICKIIGTCVGSVLIPLVGFVKNEMVSTVAVAVGSLIIGVLWSTKIGRAIKAIINHFLKDRID